MVRFYVCSKVESFGCKEIVPIESEDSGVDLTVGGLLGKIIDCMKLMLPEDNYQLICYGKRLSNTKLLSFYGIKTNAILYLYRQNKKEPLKDVKTSSKEHRSRFDDQEITNMVVASRSALMNTGFRNLLIKLHEKEFSDHLVQCTARLKDDMVALAFLRDPELLSIMINDQKAIDRVLERHPAILEALTYLAAAFHEENATGMSRPPAPSSSGFGPNLGVSYSLDDISDDEDMSGALVEGPPPDGQHVMSPTTASAFAHLISELRGNPAASGSSQNSLITREMLRQALQFTSQPPNTTTATPRQLTSPNDQPAVETPNPQVSADVRPDYSSQLQQLRDLGITNVNLCLQALQLTNGDVQAAANLIFSENLH